MSAAPHANSAYTLLVVDDNEDNRYTLTRRLKREGYTRISVAENGRLTLEMMKAQSFDLVLLDIMMPEVNGYEVLDRLKADAQLRHVPVIMISALDELDSVIRCIKLGAEDYLPKPFNPTLLRARVGACLEKKRMRDDLVHHVRRMERDLETAREIQLSMMPTDFPVASETQGLDMHATLLPAYEVGGDFYDFFWLTPERMCVLVADVSDKGAAAALHMARAKASIRFLCASEASGSYTPNTAELVERIDRELSLDNPHAMFITLLLAVVDSGSARDRVVQRRTQLAVRDQRRWQPHPAGRRMRHPGRHRSEIFSLGRERKNSQRRHALCLHRRCDRGDESSARDVRHATSRHRVTRLRGTCATCGHRRGIRWRAGVCRRRETLRRYHHAGVPLAWLT